MNGAVSINKRSPTTSDNIQAAILDPPLVHKGVTYERMEWKEISHNSLVFSKGKWIRWNIRDGGTWGWVAIPRPLPVVKPPQPLGCVECVKFGSGKRMFVYRINHPYLEGLNENGEARAPYIENCKLYPTANIPIAPELAELFDASPSQPT